MRRALAIVGVTAVLIAGLTGCKPKQKTTNLPPADELLKAAAAQMATVTSAHFVISSEGNIDLVGVRRADGRLTKEGLVNQIRTGKNGMPGFRDMSEPDIKALADFLLLRDRPLDRRSRVLQEGVAQLKAKRMDVILMDPQYAPRVLAKADRDAAVAQIAETAKQQKVDLMRRYDMMRHWYESERLPFETFVTADGLHMNDWGYACLAASLGVAIVDAATRPTETAAVPQMKR